MVDDQRRHDVKRIALSFLILIPAICVASGAGTVVGREQGPAQTALQAGEMRPPDKESSSAAPPALAETNGTIAFYSHRDGNIEIYTMKADGSDPHRVTFNEYDDGSPALSPDGSRIAFVSNRNDPDPASCAQNCFEQLYVINADGSGERKLVQTEMSAHHPDWHPDGDRITFDTESNLQGNVYVVNADGTDMNLLIEDGFWADWSPDGRQIVFASRRDGNVALYLASADGSGQRRLTRNDRFNYFPAWSPDGRRIAFTVLQDRAIYVIDADGGNERRVTRGGNAEDPAWSPDGRWIAYQSSNDGDFEIYAVEVESALRGDDGFRPVQLTDNEVGDLWPSW